MTVVPNLFGTRSWFHGRQFFHGPGVGRVVSGWFKGIAFIMHLIITSTPPQITRHCIPEAGDLWTMGSEWQEKTVTLDYCEWNLEGGCGLWEERAPGVHCRQAGHTSPEGPSRPLKVPASLSVLLINCCATSELSGFARPMSVTSESMWVWNAGVEWLVTRLQAQQPSTLVWLSPSPSWPSECASGWGWGCGAPHPARPQGRARCRYRYSPFSALQPHCSELGKLTGPPTQPQATQPSLNPSAHWPQGRNWHFALDSNGSASLPVTLNILGWVRQSSASGRCQHAVRSLLLRWGGRWGTRPEVGSQSQRWAEGLANLMKQPQRGPESPAQEQSGMTQKEPDIDWEAFILASLPEQVWRPGLVSEGQQLGTRTQKSTFSVHEGCVAVKTGSNPLAENSGPFLLQLPAFCNLIHCRNPPTPYYPSLPKSQLCTVQTGTPASRNAESL